MPSPSKKVWNIFPIKAFAGTLTGPFERHETDRYRRRYEIRLWPFGEIGEIWLHDQEAKCTCCALAWRQMHLQGERECSE